MTISVANNLRSQGFDLETFVNKPYSGSINDPDQALQKIQSVKTRYPEYFQNVPGLGNDPSLAGKLRSRMSMYILNASDRKVKPEEEGTTSPITLGGKEFVKIYLQEQGVLFRKYLTDAQLNSDKEGETFAKLALGRCYEAAEKKIEILEAPPQAPIQPVNHCPHLMRTVLAICFVALAALIAVNFTHKS